MNAYVRICLHTYIAKYQTQRPLLIRSEYTECSQCGLQWSVKKLGKTPEGGWDILTEMNHPLHITNSTNEATVVQTVDFSFFFLYSGQT